MVENRIKAFPCSGEINFTVSDTDEVIGRISDHYSAANPDVETIDGLSMSFDDWRFNVRASNTEPVLRLNVETRSDKALLAAKVAEISAMLARFA